MCFCLSSLSLNGLEIANANMAESSSPKWKADCIKIKLSILCHTFSERQFIIKGRPQLKAQYTCTCVHMIRMVPPLPYFEPGKTLLKSKCSLIWKHQMLTYSPLKSLFCKLWLRSELTNPFVWHGWGNPIRYSLRCFPSFPPILLFLSFSIFFFVSLSFSVHWLQGLDSFNLYGYDYMKCDATKALIAEIGLKWIQFNSIRVVLACYHLNLCNVINMDWNWDL